MVGTITSRYSVLNTPQVRALFYPSSIENNLENLSIDIVILAWIVVLFSDVHWLHTLLCGEFLKILVAYND